MSRFFWVLITAMLPGLVAAQQTSFFPSYDAYEEYVDGQIMSRDYIPLIMQLGGADEITPEQSENFQQQLDFLYKQDFQNRAIMKSVVLENGFEQEARVYWSGLTSYVYYYALLHRRQDGVVVMEFVLNTSPKAILERF